MSPEWIEVFGIGVAKPVSAGTNLLLAVQCWILWRARRGVPDARARLWGGFFLATSAATLMGAAKHGFGWAMAPGVFTAVLWASNVASGVSTYCAQRATIESRARSASRAGLDRLVRVQLCGFLLANLLFGPDILVLITNTAVGLVPVIAVEARAGWLGARDGRWVAAGLGVSLATPIVYVGRVTAGPWLNHIDIAHVLMGASLGLVALGCRPGPDGRVPDPLSSAQPRHLTGEEPLTSTVARIGILLLLSLAPAAPASAQGPIAMPASVAPVASTIRCAPGGTTYGPLWDEMIGTRTMEAEQARTLLVELQRDLEADVAARPDDVQRQYLLAAVLGLRVQRVGVRERVSTAVALYRQALRVLEVDPRHPGAQHILGRLHRGVLKMGRIERFIATKLMGGGELGGASWDEAQALLEAAAVGDPCTLDHHFELAQLYLDIDERDLARERLRFMMTIDFGPEPEPTIMARATTLLGELDGTM